MCDVDVTHNLRRTGGVKPRARDRAAAATALEGKVAHLSHFKEVASPMEGHRADGTKGMNPSGALIARAPLKCCLGSNLNRAND